MAVDRRTLRALAGWLLVIVAGTACSQIPASRPQQASDGYPDAAPALFESYGCVGCHAIPGVRGADALKAPPLDHFGRRSWIAGELTNDQQNLVRWIQDPQGIEPGTAMPNLGVSEEDARDMAAYLLGLD